LEQLAQELIFTPLQMTQTQLVWNNKIDISRYAIGYNKEGEAYPIEKYTKASAADNLLTTIEDYSKFMVSIMKGEGLSKAVFEDMIKNQDQKRKTFWLRFGNL
jgi:CubicO group peptidase (beta-lactamase class C family)